MPDLVLASLDDGAEASIDPTTWQHNLAALAAVGWPALDALSATPSPPHFRARRSIDGWMSFRIESAGEPPRWLDQTGAPRTRAEGLLSIYSCGELNATLPGAGSGAELALLLERLPRHKAVFVWERDWIALAAVLRVVDVADSIRGRRCILVPPDGESFLESLLGDEPGLLPPGNILRLPHVAAEWLEQVRSSCARLATDVLARRGAALGDVTRPAMVRTTAAASRVALLATQPDDMARFAATLVCDACAGSIEALRSTVNGPLDAHLLVHARRVAEFAPTHTMFVNQPPPAAFRDAGASWQWYLSAAAAERFAAGAGLLLAASPAVEAALRRGGASDERIRPFYWACVGDETVNDGACDEVVVCADHLDDSAVANGVEQPTHRMLWEKMRELARRLWETADGQRGDALLNRAERETALRVGEADVREKLVRSAGHVLIPAATTERILELLARDDQRVVLVGSGWSRPTRVAWVPGGAIQPGTGEDFWTRARLNRPPTPLSVVFVGGTDPFSAGLPIAGALGWPLMVHAPSGDSLSRALGNVLNVGQHVVGFGGYRELSGALRRLRDDRRERQRIGRRTHEHLLRHHTYRQRLSELLQERAGN